MYDLVIEGAGEAEGDEEGVGITLQDPAAAAAGGSGAGGEELEGGVENEAEERRELVLANQSRLHPGE